MAKAFNKKRSIFCGLLEKELRKSLMKCFVWSVALYAAETWTLRRNEQKTTRNIWDVDMENDGACEMDRQNKKCSYSRKNGRRKNNADTDKEEKNKLAGPLAKKELPAEGCSRRNVKREESSRQKKISIDRQHYDKLTI